MKHAFSFLLVCCGLLFLRGRPLLGEDQQFPATPYQGMQLTYDLSGVSVSHAKDSADVTRTRTLSGELQGNELRIRGEFQCQRPDQTKLRITVWVDEQKQEVLYPGKEAGSKLSSPQRFEVRVPIPQSAKQGGILLLGSSESVLGPREIQLRGSFSMGKVSPLPPESPNDSKPPEVIGQIRGTLRGTVQFRPDDWSDWKSLPSGTDVSTGMRLRTGNDGAVAMQLKSNDQLYLDQDSEVLLRGDGVQLEQGRLKVRCASNETPRVVLTRDYLIEFRGEHLGVEFLQSRTVVSILDGTATLTSRGGRDKVLTAKGGIRLEGDAQGMDLFETIDLAQENSAWEQAGLGRVAVTQTTDSIATPQPEGTTTPKSTGFNTDQRSTESPPIPTDAKTRSRIQIHLPDDPRIAVISFDTVGGYSLRRVNQEPELVIYADGRTIITDPTGRLPPLRRQLTAENVKTFLDFAVNDHHYYELSTDKLNRLITQAHASGGVPQITDMPTVVIRIGILNMTYEVRCPAPEYYASKLPEVELFQHMQAISARLRKFITASREWASQQRR